MSKRMSDRIRTEKDRILKLWEVKATIYINSAKCEAPLALRDSLPALIDDLINSLVSHDEKNLPTASAEKHGKERAKNTQFSIGEIVFEYQILREVLFLVLEEESPLPTSDRDIILDFFAKGIAESVTAFTRFTQEQLRQSEKEIMKERDKAEKYFDFVRVLMLVLNPDATIVKLNKKGCEILGYRKEEIIGRNWFEFVPKRYRNKVGSVFEKLINMKAEQVELYTNPILTRNGEERVIEWRNTSFYDEDEKKVLTLSSGEDITLRIKAEQEFWYNFTLLKTISEGTTDGIYVKDRDGRYTFINSTVERFFGKSAKEIMGKRDDEIFPKDAEQESALEIMKTDRLVMTTGISKLVEEKIMFDGETRVYLSNKSPYKDEHGRIIGLIGISRDITERYHEEVARLELYQREKEARIIAEKAVRFRDELVAMVSHDMKNPLTGITLNADLLFKESVEKNVVKKYIKHIRESAGRMNRMIEDLLDAYKGESGEFSLEKGRDVREALPMIKEAIESQEAIAKEKSIRLEACVPNRLPSISANPDRLQQVFRNLIGNAIKFTPCGGKIIVSAKESNNFVRFSVKDNGPGIDSELLPHVFERFSQAPKTAKLGAGLGLAIAKAVVEAHGGRIWVESRKEEGSTFFFTIPIAGITSQTKVA